MQSVWKRPVTLTEQWPLYDRQYGQDERERYRQMSYVGYSDDSEL